MKRFISALLLVATFSYGATTAANDDFTVLPPPQPYPAMGIWFDPEQPGTGFMFEVQNGTLVGYYSLYDGAGQPIWYLLAGNLELEPESGEGWVLETDLERYEGGACLSCPFQSPVVGTPGGEIRLTFPHRGEGRFQIDHGPERPLKPFLHGVPAFYPFMPESDALVPDLEGQWVLAMTEERSVDYLNPINPTRDHALVQLSRQTDVPSTELSYQVQRLPPQGASPDTEIEDFGVLRCERTELACRLEIDHPSYSGIIPLTTIGHDRLVYFNPDGHFGQAYRLTHSLQETPEADAPKVPLPEPGIWFDPALPGTGFMFEVQGRQLAGYYFVYHPDGNPLWYLIVGTLESGDSIEGGWKLEAELERYENGACLNCPYQPAHLAGTDGLIQMEFSGRNQGRFRIDGNDWQSLHAFTYGVPIAWPFTPASDTVMPDLSGTWILAIGEGEQLISEIAIFHNLGDDDDEGTAPVAYELEGVADFGAALASPPPITPMGTFSCFENLSAGPICELDFLDTVAQVPLADISDSFLQGHSEDEVRLRAYRLDYD